MPRTSLHAAFIAALAEVVQALHVSPQGLYFVHIPKAAGWSFEDDAQRLLGRKLPYSETNYCAAAKGRFASGVVTMLREPRSHVLSMYNHCKTSIAFVNRDQELMMPDRFEDWLSAWQSGGEGNQELLHKFCCYDPVNLQTRRLSCSKDMEAARKHLDSAYFVGIVELYHESMCVLASKVTGSLPDDCICRGSVNTTLDHHFDHGVGRHSVSALSATHLQQIDELTRKDSELYEFARTRLLAEVRRTEELHGVEILCQAARQKFRPEVRPEPRVSLLATTREKCAFEPLLS